jgi:hypothetical protein
MQVQPCLLVSATHSDCCAGCWTTFARKTFVLPRAEWMLAASHYPAMQDCTYTAFLLPITAVFRVPKYDWSWVTILDVIAGALWGRHKERT